MDAYNQWKFTPFQARFIRKAILLGVGWWQYQNDPNEYTRRLLRSCLSNGWIHSVRDDYTLRKLKAMGIENVVNTGCPTMWPLADFCPADYPRYKADSVLFMLSDYISLYKNPELDVTLVDLLLDKYKTVYFWPQGRQDLSLVARWSHRINILDHDVGSLYNLIEGSDQLDYIGTRLHGGVACLLSRRRSLILEVDNRAVEIAKDTNLTTCARGDFDFIARWITGPTDTIINMDTHAINIWRNQFTPENLRSTCFFSRGRRLSVPKIISPPESGPKMLNLGCGGSFHPDWVNMDFKPASSKVIAHDLRKPLPFRGNTWDCIYASHVLEHFSRREARLFLNECRRVLRPGGVLRIVVPDLEMIARLYLRYLELAALGDVNAEACHEWMTIEMLDQITRQRSGGETLSYWQRFPMPAENFVIERVGEEVRRFLEFNPRSRIQPSSPTNEPSDEEYLKFRSTGEIHKWMYDRISLHKLLEGCGFSDAKQCAADESAIEGFSSFFLDTNKDGSSRKPDSLYMESKKKSVLADSSKNENHPCR
jgi:predicted SAM-dependent methyltransferase